MDIHIRVYICVPVFICEYSDLSLLFVLVFDLLPSKMFVCFERLSKLNVRRMTTTNRQE